MPYSIKNGHLTDPEGRVYNKKKKSKEALMKQIIAIEISKKRRGK